MSVYLNKFINHPIMGNAYSCPSEKFNDKIILSIKEDGYGDKTVSEIISFGFVANEEFIKLIMTKKLITIKLLKTIVKNETESNNNFTFKFLLNLLISQINKFNEPKKTLSQEAATGFSINRPKVDEDIVIFQIGKSMALIRYYWIFHSCDNSSDNDTQKMYNYFKYIISGMSEVIHDEFRNSQYDDDDDTRQNSSFGLSLM